MSVVEKDRVVSEMLRDELRRCREMAAELERVAAQLPRGSLGLRKKRHGAREYTYHCLKYREGEKVVSRHVATDDVEALARQLDERRRYEQEIQQLRKRISYLEKLLGVGAP